MPPFCIDDRKYQPGVPDNNDYVIMVQDTQSHSQTGNGQNQTTTTSSHPSIFEKVEHLNCLQTVVEVPRGRTSTRRRRTRRWRTDHTPAMDQNQRLVNRYHQVIRNRDTSSFFEFFTEETKMEDPVHKCVTGPAVKDYLKLISIQYMSQDDPNYMIEQFDVKVTETGATWRCIHYWTLKNGRRACNDMTISVDIDGDKFTRFHIDYSMRKFTSQMLPYGKALGWLPVAQRRLARRLRHRFKEFQKLQKKLQSHDSNRQENRSNNSADSSSPTTPSTTTTSMTATGNNNYYYRIDDSIATSLLTSLWEHNTTTRSSCNVSTQVTNTTTTPPASRGAAHLSSRVRERSPASSRSPSLQSPSQVPRHKNTTDAKTTTVMKGKEEDIVASNRVIAPKRRTPAVSII